MTYHSGSDVPVPYGRVIRTEDPPHQRNYHAEKEDGVAILASNCGGRSGRYHYLDSLMKHLPVKYFPFNTVLVLSIVFRLLCGVAVAGGTISLTSVQVSNI